MLMMWKSWFDLRRRFYCSLIALMIVMSVVLASYSTMIAQKPDNPFRQELLKDVYHGYSHYMDRIYFVGNAYVILLIASIVLALGGILAQKKKKTILVTISFPVKRWQWVVAHAGTTAFLVLILAVVAALGSVLGSYLMGESYPLCSAILSVQGLWLACFPWIGLSLLLNSYLRNSIGSGLILILASWIGLNVLVITVPAAEDWCLRRLSDPGFWMGRIPWESILCALLIGVGSIALAARRFMRQEY
jgi:ABC-type transport system involved in multi-copper enzyme maturation permease subunit